MTASTHKLVRARKATRQDYPLSSCTGQLVAEQAAATPDSLAVATSNERLNYRELNQRANQIAHYLQAAGVGPGVLVSCCLERSADLVVSMLGILKAGGAYLPLDSTYPSERVAFMLNDARVPVLITQQHIMSRLLPRAVHVVNLDTDAPALERQSSEEPASTVTADDFAYVIYTSGSTGQPKGVQIKHKGLLNLLFWHQRAFAVTTSDRATQVTSPSFDATGWELWPYLTTGASVHFADEITRATPAALRDWLVDQHITVTFLPTPLAERVMRLKWPQHSSLRLLLTGGDKLHSYPPPALPFAVVNNYGPTEATVVATSGVVPPLVEAAASPSIGWPIANTEIYMLGEDLRQVPTGEVGELCIGGDGVAGGYLNRQELTAERFIPNPFSGEAGAQLYRTGDLARQLPDGQIAFMGRVDHQVKIRGHRIELDEIAFVLSADPAIQTSVVVDREETQDDKRLVAYITTVPGKQTTASALRDALATRLPDYMIPSAFVVLDELPLTPNGKVDRAALPPPSVANTLRDRAPAAARTPTEGRLAAIVAALLHVEQLSVDDNFFLIGGNSMMGAQLIAQAAETFGVDLPLRTLFEKPTVRQLAQEMEHRVIAGVESLSEDEVLELLEERS